MIDYFKQCCIIIFLPTINQMEDETQIDYKVNAIKNIQEITKTFPTIKHLYYNSSIELNDTWENNDYSKFLKNGIDDGEKMEHAFENAFSDGFRKVILIKGTCTGLKSEHLNEALLSLKFIEFSIGPDKKGGYYLIGMNQFEPIIFQNKDWNSESLLKSTIREIGNLKSALYKLPVLE